MQHRIFLIVDNGTPNSHDTAHALVAEFVAHSAWSATATATSSTTSIGMGRLPLPGVTLKSPVLKFEREKFLPGLGIEPGPLALCARTLTIMPSRTTADPR